MNLRKMVALLVVVVGAQGVVVLGLAGSASAATMTPTIKTTPQPTSATVGSSIVDQATVTGTTATCPAQDEAGFPLGEFNTTGTTLFCSYPAFPGENPTDFYCDYDTTTGALTLDNDAGFCPATAATTGGPTATGTVTFNLYNNSTATGPALFTDTENLVSGSATSVGYTVTATGTDYWVATYSGDGTYNPVSSSDSGESVTVSAATPLVSTTASSGSVTLGQSISDGASVTGGDSPTGTVTFNLYSNNSCTGPALFSDTENLVSGSSTSADYTVTATGTDYWVATYNGDSHNNTASSSCSAEPVAVGQLTPTVTVGSSANPAPRPGPVTYKVTVTGVSGFTPTGSVTVSDGTNSCDITTLSAGFGKCVITESAGSYTVVASYSGDANFIAMTGQKSETVDQATPTVKIRPSGNPARVPRACELQGDGDGGSGVHADGLGDGERRDQLVRHHDVVGWLRPVRNHGECGLLHGDGVVLG